MAFSRPPEDEEEGGGSLDDNLVKSFRLGHTQAAAHRYATARRAVFGGVESAVVSRLNPSDSEQELLAVFGSMVAGPLENFLLNRTAMEIWPAEDLEASWTEKVDEKPSAELRESCC